jgi:hypothetical protein
MRLCPQSEVLIDLIATMGPTERRILMLTIRRVITLQEAGEEDEAADFLEDLRNVLASPALRRRLTIGALNS